MEIEKIKIIEAIKHYTESMNKLVGHSLKIKLDYENERFIATEGIIFKKEITNKSFDEIIDEFISRLY